MSRIRTWLKAHFPLLVVVVAYVWSAAAIASYRMRQVPPDAKVVLRLGHWQLEPGVREGFREMAEAYRALHPGVVIVQDAIPEGTYGQWLTTQLMGGTAPDIIEMGIGVPYNVMVGFFNRYFLPLTPYVSQSNPYNEGSSLAGVPWRNTYKDGMRSGYIEEMQEYMTVPLSQFSVRIFYNRDLLKRLTGLSEPPSHYRDFLAVCEMIKSRRNERGQPYIPITCSAYHFAMWESRMIDPLTFPAIRRADFNRDGAVDNAELFIAFRTGRLDFDFPPIAARFKMVSSLTAQFQPGFTGLGRDEAVFLFVQQRAVFITTGTWDAGALVEQAKGVFDLGIMDFPLPKRDDPEFGSILEGPVYERASSALPLAVTRSCKHPEVAIDFLRFIASRQGNEAFNRRVGWTPAIRDTEVPPMLKAFAPLLEGIYGCMPITLGGDTIVRWSQLYDLYKVNQISFSDMAAAFVPFFREKGLREFEEAQRNNRRAMVRDEQLLAVIRAEAMTADETGAGPLWVKYRLLTAKRLIARELIAAQLRATLEKGSVKGAGPYEMTPETLEKARLRLAAGAGKDVSP